MKLSIIIKALNEEEVIARAIESALAAVQLLGGDGEVILADSLSTDATVEIASRYPVRIVQLKHPGDRSCGVGAELGFRIASGEFVYILDADMELVDGFIVDAVAYLESHPEVAGVSGRRVEVNQANAEFVNRARQIEREVGEDASSLSCGGLYRYTALKEVGYFTHRYLHSFEEYELGVRLRHNGWRLTRLAQAGVRHYGHTIDEYRLLSRRIRSGYINGVGELFRAALGKPYFFKSLLGQKQFAVVFLYLSWLLSGVAGVAWVNVWVGAAVLGSLPLLMLAKKRSMRSALYSVVSGVANSFGFLRGIILFKRENPAGKLDYVVLK